MKMRILASSKLGYTLPTESALVMAGQEAGICYMKDDFDALLAEPRAKTLKRALGTVSSGHHSVAGHPVYNLVFEGLPKIVAMLLNNEPPYNTSEKSARYTHMETTAVEQAIYNKWIGKFRDLIAAKYPQIEPKTVEKLAMENARYFISVFTPATMIGYTADLRQINYLIGWCEELYTRPTEDLFLLKLRPWLVELADMLRDAFNVDGLRDNKGRKFSLFAQRGRRESVDENYSVNYLGTFAQLAQAQRHRTLSYEMQIPNPEACEFYVPPIINDESLRLEYLLDMRILAQNYPQGMLVLINERGTIEDFCLKCHERLCGAAQLEICTQTEATLQKLLRMAMDADYPEIFDELSVFDGKSKCQLGYYRCDRPCPLGPQHAFDRLI